MNLHKKDVELFFKLHPALLQYVNQRLRIFPKIKTAEALRTSGVEKVTKVREALWKNLNFLDEFVSKNPAGFSQEECGEIISWKNAIQGKFYIFRHLKKYSIFLTEKRPTKIYGVYSLNDRLDEIFLELAGLCGSGYYTVSRIYNL
ncbi:MAG: hypothetical protein A3C90_02405 [Candidatus Magasanikbacteria bacterium RIFCSPHIGHO2_02_FULL_51_14]|uniref:Uncharacterized protein n=1 Tax=Candidatus Magasanikbacteria bacterium RIFCSPHIGHO2_02_FULL_51_14 TaxID=1798683 RepID=A0A1F6MQL4_9BACT|nr:MAG: hypothetical protein A3C90_02405 [Candidatus Magasanikbacteria bacterium RIFCSPHIGHO2_02_FULL_51_14]